MKNIKNEKNKKFIITGGCGFIGSNLSKNLSKYFKVDSFSFEEIYKKDNFFFKDYFCIINTTIHKKYVKTKYNKLLDLDRKFISKFGNIKFFYIFLNSRKIYMSKENQTERSRLKPLNNYSKNKLITENYLKKKN